MTKFTNAPHLKEPWNNQLFSDLIILAGSDAWGTWGKGKGTMWRILVDGLKMDYFHSKNEKVHPYDQKPVILDVKQLTNLDRTRICNPDQRAIKIFQCGELTQEQKTAICLNLATNNKVNGLAVGLYNGVTMEKEENLSGYIERLRTQESEQDLAKTIAKDASKKADHSIRENDRTSEKSKSFYGWLNWDMALHRENHSLYRYEGKIWNTVDEIDIKHKVVEFFELNNQGYSERSVNSLIETLKIQIPLMRNSDQSIEFIAFNNGILNRTTGEFKPHTRDLYLTNIIPYDYQNNAVATPNFDKWLDFVSEGNADKSKNILAALYAILTNRYDWQMFIEINGVGGSGKSIFANIATLLAGERNTASGCLFDLDVARERASFFNKRLIILPEQTKYGGSGAGLKGISGGDVLRLDPKNEKPFNAIIPAVILIVNNEPTIFTERAGGIERRRVIFCFDKPVPAESRDEKLTEKLSSEIGGIIRKLLDTFKDANEAKQALESQKNSKEALEVKMFSDHIAEFCQYFETRELINGLFIGNSRKAGCEKTHLFPAYCTFTSALNIKHELSLNNFSNALSQGLQQHGNNHNFKKTRTKNGVKTNVFYRDFEAFFNNFIKP
ncbi:DNA primase family protein [Lonepinella sp. BR2919]|uniref:DNA primase family protein n=1 Tax=unclassified Lonepinella TaxID=2642006 RepID=UPI003F6E0F29